MIRVLVAEPLEPFLRRERVPDDVAVDLLPERARIRTSDHAGLITLLTRRIGKTQLDRLPSLRVIANFAVGYDNIDVPAARARGVAVAHTPGVLTVATAELTWALIFATARRVGEGERLVRQGRWTGWAPTQLVGMGLDGKRLGIVGAGRIGQEVGRRAAAFGMDVIYVSRSRKPDWEAATGAEFMPLVSLLAEADVVSLHLPYSDSTSRIIDEHALWCMKESAILINTARGALVDEEALVRALKIGSIRAAGLDVYAREPRMHPGLLEQENVVLLPHLGSATEEARAGMWRLAWKNLMLGVRGRPLANPVPETVDA